MIITICIIGYLLMIFGFCLWDSWIGMPVKWNGYDAPGVWLAAIFWVIAVPIVCMIAFSNYLKRAKADREKKEEHQWRVRVAAEKELDKYQEEVEEEVKKLVAEAKKL